MLPLLVIASPVAAGSLCRPEQIVAAGAVTNRPSTTWPNYPNGPIPDDATIAQRMAHDLAANGLVPLTGGVGALGAIEARWPLACRVDLREGHAWGGWTVDGINVGWQPEGPITAERRPLSETPEPPHPDLPGARFVGSAATSAFGWRLGVWRHGSHDYRLAAYRSGAATAPRPVARSTVPVLAISYLPTPEGRGGAFTILQRLGRNAYRRVGLGWTGQGELPTGG